MKVIKQQKPHYFKCQYLRDFAASFKEHGEQLRAVAKIENIKREKERQIMLCHRRLRKIQQTYKQFKHYNFTDEQILINAGYTPKYEFERGFEAEQARLKYIQKHNLEAQYQ